MISKSSQKLSSTLEIGKENQIASSLNQLPGGRIVLKSALNFLFVFDRLQFYYYHKANYS